MLWVDLNVWLVLTFYIFSHNLFSFMQVLSIFRLQATFMYWHKTYTQKWKFLKQMCVFFADAVAHVFSGTYTYLLWKKFLKVLLFHQSSAKFATKIKHFHFSHNYYKPSLKNMIANLKRHNLKHDPRITPVEVLSASKTCTFS